MAREPGQEQMIKGIPDYATCDAATRARLDEIIESVDPFSFSDIIGFGKEATDRLAEAAERVMRNTGMQDQLLDTVESAGQRLAALDIGEFADKTLGMGARGIGYLVKNPGTALATLGAMCVLGPVGLVLPVAKHKYQQLKDRREARMSGADLAETLHQTIAGMDRVIADLEKARDEIPGLVQGLEDIGTARVQAFRESGIYFAAGKELLRRFDEELIPALQRELEEGDNPEEAEMNLETLETHRTLLDRRLTDITAGMVASQVVAATLMKLRNTFAMAAGKIETHMTTSVPHWRALMTEAGLQIAASKIGQTLDAADKFANTALIQSVELGQHSARQMRNSAKTGTYDPTQLAQVLQTVAKGFQDDVRQIGAARQGLQQQRERLADLSNKFSDTVAAAATEAKERRNALPAPAPSGTGRRALPGSSVTGLPGPRR